ncbi:hypothetical protein PIB30_032402 [Stylosanthes scabra]|uniref:Uncharacterized protein n=1 Tax=Stylosanthes scabra TaxID=79078 RepID=A0ABU6XAA8_9FABA|nr:hypothetical protein [Stylosanthes scabra]
MRSRTGVAGDPSVAAVPVDAQSGEAMAWAPSGMTDHSAAGWVRSVTRSHTTMAAATGCGSRTGVGTAGEPGKVTDRTAAGKASSTTDNGAMATDNAAAGMTECTNVARAGSTGIPDDGRPTAALAIGSEFLNFQNRDSIVVEESKPEVRLTAGFVNK